MIDLIKEICRSYWPEKRSYKIVVATFGILFLWFLSGLFSFSSEEKKQEKDKLTKVMVRKVSAKLHSPITIIPALTEEQRFVEIRAETESQVIEIPKQKGDSVSQGDVLVKLSLDTRRDKLTGAKALLEQRKLEFDVAKKLEKKSYRSKTSLADAKAKYESAVSNLRDIENSIQDTKIQAPFNGIMNNNMVEVGSFVKVGDPVVEIVDLDPIKVVAFVSEKELCCVKIGGSVDVRFNGGSIKNGVVKYSSVRADQRTRTFRVEIDVENADYELKAGLTVEALIKAEGVKAHHISSGLLLLNDDGILGVHGINKDNIVEFYAVTIFSHEDDLIWVEGIPDQARIVTVGQDFVIPGQHVDPVLEKAPIPPVEKAEASANASPN